MAENLPEHLLFCCLVLVRAPQLKHIIMLSSSGPKFFHVQFQMCSATHVVNILCLGLHHHLVHLQMAREKLQLAQFWILNFILQSSKTPVTSQPEKTYLPTLVAKTREKSVAGQAWSRHKRHVWACITVSQHLTSTQTDPSVGKGGFAWEEGLPKAASASSICSHSNTTLSAWMHSHLWLRLKSV